jgi:D-psicose/D-tagatose/L-ribulose 3-epimerase
VTRLAVSNIAWPADEEREVAAALAELGVRHVEIAPTKTFLDPLDVSEAELDAYQTRWADHGIDVVAFQSMLFGRLDLELFGTEEVRRSTIDYLEPFIRLAGRLGATALVFGSPKNRRVPTGMTDVEASDIAISFFDELGAMSADHGTVFCIEPNPPQYECNFVTTASAGADLVRAVDNPGFRLHLDSAGMTLAGDRVGDAVRSSADVLHHFHVSAPNLGEIETDVVQHAAAAEALREVGFPGYISIEMRPGRPGEAVDRVRRAVAIARDEYDAGRGPRD